MRPSSTLCTTMATSSVDETSRIGETLGRLVKPGDIVGLVGLLGSGKTLFARALAHGLGVLEHRLVNSPTFTIINVYDTPGAPLVHLDLYRVETAQECLGFGLDELVAGESPMVVEWFDRFASEFPEDTLVVSFEINGETGRTLHFQAGGPISRELLDALVADLGSTDR